MENYGAGYQHADGSSLQITYPADETDRYIWKAAATANIFNQREKVLNAGEDAAEYL